MTNSNNRLITSLKAIPTFHLVLFGIILGGTIFRIWMPFIYNPIDALWSDPGRHWEYATKGVSTHPLSFIDPIFFQVWLSAIAKITLDIPVLTALYSGILSAITPWIWYRWLREALPSKQNALIGWAILAWIPSWIGIYSYYMTETLQLPLLGLAMWLSWRSMRKKDVPSIVWLALVWTLAGLTRGIAAPLAAVATLFVWCHHREKIKSALAAGSIVLLILGFTGYRTYEKTGVFAPLGIGTMNGIYSKSGRETVSLRMEAKSGGHYQYGFQSPVIGEKPFAPFSDWETMRKGRVYINVDLDDQAASWKSQAENLNKIRPPQLPLVADNLILLLFSKSWPDCNEKRFLEDLSVSMRWVWVPVFLAAFILLIRNLLRKRLVLSSSMLLALFGVWFVVQGLVLLAVNEGRYRKPAEGLAIAGIILGLSGSKKEEEENPDSKSNGNPKKSNTKASSIKKDKSDSAQALTVRTVTTGDAAQLSIVVPMHNESESIDTFFERIESVMSNEELGYEIVCINDGSTDDTLERLVEHRSRNERIKIIDLSRNFGKETALTAGLDHCEGQAVIPIDADLQDPPELIPLMIEKWLEGYDCVYGRRSARDSDGLLKRITAESFYKTFNAMSHTEIPYNTGDFRLIDRKLVDTLKQLPERNRFMKGLFSWVGFKQIGIDYERPKREAGTSSFGFWKLWNFALDGITSFTTIPLRIWGYVGVGISAFALLYAAYTVIRTMIFGIDVPGYASLLVVILCLGGLQLFTLGVIGEYLGRIYTESKQRPLYLIQKSYGVSQSTKSKR